MRTLLLTLVLLAPLATALVPQDDVFVYTSGGSLLVDVRYADGIGTTKFGFTQLAGEGGGPEQRLEAGALCTEWIGTFTQVLIEAAQSDNVAQWTMASVGQAHVVGDGLPNGPGWTLDAIGGPGAFKGSLIVCDNAAGQGQVRLLVSVEKIPLARANPAMVRISEA